MTRAFHCDDFDTPHDYIPTKNIFDPNLAPKRDILGQNWPFLGPLGAQKRADTRPKCVVTIILTQTEQPVAVGTKFGPPGPSWDLWGTQKGHFVSKLVLLGPLGPRKRANIRPKCVVTM